MPIFFKSHKKHTIHKRLISIIIVFLILTFAGVVYLHYAYIEPLTVEYGTAHITIENNSAIDSLIYTAIATRDNAENIFIGKGKHYVDLRIAPNDTILHYCNSQLMDTTYIPTNNRHAYIILQIHGDTTLYVQSYSIF